MSVNLLFNQTPSTYSSSAASSATTTPLQNPAFYGSNSIVGGGASPSLFSNSNNNNNIFNSFPSSSFSSIESSTMATAGASSRPSTSTSVASSLLPPTLDNSTASTLLVAAAAKAAAATATLIQQQRNNSGIFRSDEERKIDELLLPALIGHEISNIISSASTQKNSPPTEPILNPPQPPPQPPPTWRCANLPTTLQVLNSARDNFPNYIAIIDTLRQSLTQTIFVSLINASINSPINGIEMPNIASLAPNNTSLHLVGGNNETQIPSVNKKADNIDNFKMQVDDDDPIIVSHQHHPSDPSPDDGDLSEAQSRIDSFPFSVGASSPTKSELSINTTDETSSVDIRSDMGSLSIKSEKEGTTKPSLRSIKKRVVCEKCQKSFCDKGALKIHNSSVHLREMHICTVPGCMKQFPSKRSRNRHSNNPNMHTDAGRRRNCRSTTLTQSKHEECHGEEDAVYLMSPQHHHQTGPQFNHQSPKPQQQQQSVQNPPSSSAQNILNILQRLIPNEFQAAASAHNFQQQSPGTASVKTQVSPSSASSSFSLPQQNLLPSQNPELSGLLKFMIAQKQKPTFC